jgi:hypothetical protein
MAKTGIADVFEAELVASAAAAEGRSWLCRRAGERTKMNPPTQPVPPGVCAFAYGHNWRFAADGTSDWPLRCHWCGVRGSMRDDALGLHVVEQPGPVSPKGIPGK